MKITITLLTIFLAATPLVALDLTNPEQGGLGGCYYLSRPTASTLASVPVASLQPGNGRLDLGWQRQYDMSAFDHVFAAAAYRMGRLTLAGGFVQFGDDDLYSEKTVKVAAAANLYEHFSAGVTFSYLHAGFGGNYDALGTATFGAVAGYRYRQLLVAIEADNLSSPRLDPDVPGWEPKLTLNVELMGQGSYSVLARTTVEKYQKPQLALAQVFQVSEVGALFWGVQTEPTSFGGGVRLRYSSGEICYAGNYHPSLGYSQSLSLAYAFGG